MNRLIKIIFVLFAFVIMSCTKNPTSIKDTFDVSGTVYFSEQQAQNVTMSLIKDDQIIKETTTDSLGNFIFNDIVKGVYNLKSAKTFEDSSYIENIVDLDVMQDIILDYLTLPKPVTLYSPLSIADDFVKLCWSIFDSDLFYEYKLYRNYSSALDENHGELVHISTSVNDTIFCDSLLSRNTNYYYRVYVNNMYGRMSGSNILKVKTNKWEDKNSFTTFYYLTVLSSISGFIGKIQGIDYDGESLWIVTLEEHGGFYDNNTVRIYRYNVENDSDSLLFEYNDEYIPPSGLVCTNEYLWICYNEGSGHNPRIKKINKVTGEIVRTFSISYGVEDISFDGENLLLCYYYNKIEKIDIGTFSLINTFNNPFGAGSNYGIAYRQGEIWLTDRADDQIAIINESGEQIGFANTDELESWNDFSPRICFMNENLLMVKDSRIIRFEISEINQE